MTIKEDIPDINSVENLLFYMDEFPHSGQNRAAAKLIRELQNTVEKLLRICYSVYQVAGVLDADERILDVLSDPAGATDEQVEAMLPYFSPSAPLVAVSGNAKPRKGLLWDSQWSNIVNHDHGYENFSKEDAVHHAVKLTEERIAKNLAGQTPDKIICDICFGKGYVSGEQNGIIIHQQCFRCLGAGSFAGQVAPQATADIEDACRSAWASFESDNGSDDLRYPGFRSIWLSGRTFGVEEDMEPQATVELTDELDLIYSILDGFQTSIARADGMNAVKRIRALLATPPTSKATQEIANLTDELDCMNRNYQALLTEHNALKATSKADTGEAFNAGAEEAAVLMDEMQKNAGNIHNHYGYAAKLIRALKSAPPTIEALTVEQKIGTYRDGWNNAVLDIYIRCLLWAEARKAKHGGNALNNFAEEIYKQYAPLKSATPSTIKEEPIGEQS